MKVYFLKIYRCESTKTRRFKWCSTKFGISRFVEKNLHNFCNFCNFIILGTKPQRSQPIQPLDGNVLIFSSFWNLHDTFSVNFIKTCYSCYISGTNYCQDNRLVNCSSGYSCYKYYGTLNGKYFLVQILNFLKSSCKRKRADICLRPSNNVSRPGRNRLDYTILPAQRSRC